MGLLEYVYLSFIINYFELQESHRLQFVTYVGSAAITDEPRL